MPFPLCLPKHAATDGRFFLWPWMAGMPEMQEQFPAMPWMAGMPER
jgi:hypothetical protein